jgi:hypothetical protein
LRTRRKEPNNERRSQYITGPASNEQHDEHRERRPGQRLLWILIVVAVLVGWLPHHKRNKEVDAKAKQQQNSVPVVEVQIVHGASAEQELTLPGTVTPLKSAHIYARASRFLKARYVDLGDTGTQRAAIGVDLGTGRGRYGLAAGVSSAAE